MSNINSHKYNKKIVVNSGNNIFKFYFIPDILSVIAGIILYIYIDIYMFLLILGLYLIYRIYIHIKSIEYFNGGYYYLKRESIEKDIYMHNKIAKSLTRTPKYFEFRNTYQRGWFRYKHDTRPNIHKGSLQILRGAKNKPVEYIVKYFDININERDLGRLETLNDYIHRMKKGIQVMNIARNNINRKFRHPWFINIYYSHKLNKAVPLYNPHIEISFERYIFEYTSPAGRKQQHLVIHFDDYIIQEMVIYLSQKLEYQKTAKYQRSLMTPKLRQYIIERDNYTCQNPYCGKSQIDDPELELEVDHTTPIAKGGKTTIENLKTLCRPCNRSKSDKLEYPIPM